MPLLEDALKALKSARREYEEYIKTRDPMKFRDACEKGWLSVVLATDYLITCVGIDKPRGRGERNELLEALEKHVDEIRKVGLPDRMWARSTRLHACEGWISDESLKIELEKVEKYLKDMEKVAEVISSRSEELKPILKKIQEKFRR